MSARTLSRRLILEDGRLVPDGSGGFEREWQSLGVVWAEFDAGAGREREIAGGLSVSGVTYRIFVRSAPPGSPRRPRPEQRFREDGRIFRILAVADDDARGRFLVCHAREEVSA